MKSVNVRDLQKKVKECIDASQQERVVITRHGRPAAVLIGVEGEDWETVVLQNDPAFWQLIHERRQQPTMTLEEAKRQLGLNAEERKPAARRRRGVSNPGASPQRARRVP